MSPRSHELPAPPNRRLLLKGALAAGALATALPSGVAHAAAAQPQRHGRPYVNPLVRNRADPHIHRHTDGFYYFTATAPEYDRIILRRSRTMRGLATADESVIWRKHETGRHGCAHLGAGDPPHRRQVVHLLRLRARRGHLGHPHLGAGELPPRPVQGDVGSSAGS